MFPPQLSICLCFVAIINHRLALCDQLEARLKDRAGVQTRFKDAVVKSIGRG
jgi:hypothetical protein